MAPRKRKPDDIEVAASCATCKHWLPIEEVGRRTLPETGICRAHPPEPVVLEDELRWVNPPTPSDHGCGEHLMRPHS